MEFILKIVDMTQIDNLDLKKVYDFLSGLCGQGYEAPDIVTNCSRFKKHEFNDYKNYYW